jgi:hypothetical protein
LQIGILQAIAGFYAYFCVLFEFGIEPQHMIGMDDDVLFVPQKNKEKMTYGYFMNCFDDSSLECAYTPQTFDCNFVDWDDAWEPFKAGNDWGMTNFGDYSSLGFTSNPTQDRTYCNENKANMGTEVFGKLMFASMYCQWAGGSESECTYTVTNGKIMLPNSLEGDDLNSYTAFTGINKDFVFKSKAQAKGVVLHTSDRYANRYCSTEDYFKYKDLDGGDTDWSDGPETGDLTYLSAVRAIISKRYYGTVFEDRKLCDNENESITMGDQGNMRHMASIYPMQMLDRHTALASSNTAYFISIIVVQWADLMICKTRSRSLFEQGMTNVFMNWSLFFETALGAFLCYVPLAHAAVGTMPIDFVWWTPAVPFSIAIYCYDELRKGVIRQYPKGWLQHNTYW